MPVLEGFHHVRLPVSDVGKSLEWYTRVLRLEVSIEFIEDGVLGAVALSDANRTLTLALREDPRRAATLAGFNALAFGVPTVRALRAWSDHLDLLGVEHSGIAESSAGWLIGGIIDPDGAEIRLFTHERRP
jgi:catechol 2,3-dioxygenase-like lactoylglutathione lyase family enzyme